MSKKILSLLSIFFLMLFVLVGCKDPEGKITIQVDDKMEVGETYQVKYELENIEDSVKLTWEVSDPTVADLDSAKLTIKALKEGSFTITVTAESGESASKKVIVEKGEEPNPPHVHTEEVLAGKAATCTEAGLTEGKKCSECGEILVAQTEIPALGHKEVVVAGKAATCTEKGLTEGKKCSECGEVLVEQTEIPALGHKYEEGKCTVCGAADPDYKPDDPVVPEPPKPDGVYGITYEVYEGILLNAPAEYDGTKDVYLFSPIKTGFHFQGWYTNAEFTGEKVEKIAKGSSGDIKLYAKWSAVPQSIVYEMNGGAWGEVEGPSYYTIDKETLLVAPVLENAIFLGWYDNADFEGEVIEKIEAGLQGEVKFYAKWELTEDPEVPHEHTEEVLPGKEATCTEAGLTEGKKCSECGEILVPQEEIPAKGHDYVDGKCTVCGSDDPDYVDPSAPVAVLEANGNSNFWGAYTNTIFLNEGKLVTNATFSFRIGISKEDDGTLKVTQIAQSGDSGFVFDADYGMVISESHANWASMPVADIVVGLYVTIEGDTSTGVATVKFYTVKPDQGGEEPEVPHVHTEEILPGKEATCEEPGLTEGKKCSECGEILVPQEEIPAKGHDYVDGKCTVCGADDPNYQPAEKPDMTIVDAFAAELVGDFNTYGGSTTETVRENFKATSHPQIKSVFALPEMLEKYKWFFEFSLEEITNATNANIDSTHEYYVHYENTKIMLEGMIAGDTNAVNINDGGNARTLWRFWVEGLINAKLPNAADIYAKSMVDYSVDANLNRFIAAYKEANAPKPNREDLEVFAKQIVDLFNSTGASDAKVTTREDFKATTHPNIKYVWNKAENLEAYKWLFEFALEEITAAATANEYLDNGYYTNIKGLLEKMIAGDTTAVGGDYADGRTILRWWIQGLINAALAPADDVYAKLMVDYSVEENLNRFLVLYAANKPAAPEHTHTEEVLPGKEATCDETGLTEGKKCSECGEILVPQEEIPAKGHSYVDGKCTVCGADDPNYNPDQPEVPEGNLIVDATDPNAYATIAAALEAAKDGDSILVKAGTYETAEITKSVTILGANAGVNPVTEERTSETIFTGDLIIAADNVTIDGICVTGKGRIVGSAAGVKNAVIVNVLSKESTVNGTSADSATAPIYFATTTADASFENIVINQVKYTGSTGRPMIFYGSNINGLTITNSEFIAIGVKSNYNDGIKIESIEGNVNISSNYFEQYYQYVIWFMKYAEGNYKIANNTYKDCGQTAGSHTGARFATYNGAEDGIVNITFAHNTLDNAYSLIRLDANSSRTADTQIVKVNYNKVLNCGATYYVDNRNAYDIDATNNYYDVTPVAGKFNHAIWEPYCANESDLPEYIENEEFDITYELNGGSWELVEYETTVTGEPTKTIEVGSYSNTGLASGIYFCDQRVTPQNSLRWQYKLILKYDETKQAYLVVATDAAKASTNNAAGGAENWTHAIASASIDVSTYATVGQYIVIDAELSTDMAAFQAKAYDASAISATEKKTVIEHAEKYTEKGLPLDLATPVLAGKEFYGWYKEADFSGDRLFALPMGTTGDITLYARFVEPGWEEPTFGTLEFVLNDGLTSETLPTEYQFGVELELPTLVKQDYKFLGWTLEENGTDYLAKLPKTLKEENVTLYAQFELKAIYVGAGKDYATIAEALAAAEEGTIIIVDAATYAEDVVIDKKGIVLVGTTDGEAMTTLSSVTIEADNVVLEGLKLTATNSVKIKAGDNVVITECKLGGTASANNQSILLVSGAVEGLQVLDNEFFASNPNGNSHYRAILAEQYVTNATIRGNVFKTDSATTVYIDSVKLTKVAGIISIEENTFDWPGDNFTVFLGSSAIAANTTINVNRNQFVSETPMSGFTTRYADDTTTINYIGNVFHNVKGTVMEARGTASSDRATKSKVTIADNAIQDTSSKISIAMSNELVVLENNYIFQDIVFSNNTATVTNPAADKDAALAGVTTHNVTFVANGGVIPGSAPTTFVEGAALDVTSINPRLDAMRLVGWYDNAEFAGEAVTALGAQTADVTLYAKYEAIPVYKVTYELAGGTAQGLVKEAFEGTIIKLPTPEQLGATFLGWSLTEGSTEYITSFELLEDVTVYANWTTAERYDVTFVLNGGSINYESREALVNDFIADYSAAMGKSYVTGADIPTGSFAEIDYHTFYTKTLANGTTVRDKWLWLAEYIYELSVRDLASNNCNVLGLKALINNSTYSGDAIYGISYAFRAFLIGTTIRPGTSYTSVDFTVYENANGFWESLSKVEEGTRVWYGGVELPKAYSGSYNFLGWYTNPEFTGDAVTEITESTTLYAKFAEGSPVDSISITNKITEIKRFETLQLEWVINPADATIQTVKFESSNPEVATVDDKGFITALTNGTVTIKIISQAAGSKSDEFTMEVYSPDHFEAEYEGESYIAVDGTTQLLAEYVKRDGTTEKLVWSSLTPDIAIVDAAGSVRGKAEGVATIRVALESNSEVYLDMYVTVVKAELAEIMQFIVNNHESNVFTRYELGIGAGTPAYYADIYGSVSNIFYNHEFKYDDRYLAAGDASGDYYANTNVTEGLEFVTFHYTAGFDATADTDNHASYFSSGSADVSIHYVTGNAGNANGEAEIYKVLSHEHGAWHAGDSNSRYYSNSTKKNAAGELIFTWMPTGVAYDGTDLLDVKWSASNDFYFEINGKKTSIKLPETYDYKSRGTTHIYNADGTISSTATFNANYGYAKIENRQPEDYFNAQGFPVTVIDGEYYMGPTWWSFGQTVAGMICGSGGNRNSIGIESCVNQGSDLWYTWQVTGQLIANLLKDNGLGLERVKGHHFFDGKDCPQPLLENDLEIWWEIMDVIAAEKDILDKYADYEISFKSNNEAVISENGRVIAAPDFGTSVTYTVTVSKDGQVVDTITLATMVPGAYEKA